MKKVLGLLLCLGLTITNFCVPTVVYAETLGDLKKDLAKTQNELQANKNKKAETQAEINNANNEIAVIKNNISAIFTELANLDKEIENLDNDIKKKKKEMDEILSFVQISNGEEAYLEYAFGAQDFTDFIYRVAIAEQLTKYNEQLINDYKQKIEDSRKKQEEMKEKQASLANEQEELKNKMALLGEQLQNLDSVGMDIEDSIEYQKEVIALYESKGCGDNEDIATCGRKILPAGTAFYRPTEYGVITSEWGPRNLLSGWHEGIDIGVRAGTTVYSVANGMVAGIVRYNCGGNMVVVHHNVNGQTYTSVYAHLSSVAVSEGQTVNRNTVIGYSGGTPGGYDQCTFGEHLHLTIAVGLFWVDYYDWTNDLNINYSRNPRNYINFPWSEYWDDRITAY